MTSLPLISHHLFVAAAGQESGVRRKARPAANPTAAPSRAVTLPLILMDRSQAVPEAAMRAARVATHGGAV